MFSWLSFLDSRSTVKIFYIINLQWIYCFPDTRFSAIVEEIYHVISRFSPDKGRDEDEGRRWETWQGPQCWPQGEGKAWPSNNPLGCTHPFVHGWEFTLAYTRRIESVQVPFHSSAGVYSPQVDSVSDSVLQTVMAAWSSIAAEGLRSDDALQMSFSCELGELRTYPRASKPNVWLHA